ncbi:MAG: hypothetical protein Fues2KO_29860 [Fuerstiella sp.]
MREIESDFARNALERDQLHQANHAWKGRSGVWGSLGMEPPGVAPWEIADPARTVRFVCVARGGHANELLYVLQMGGIGGLFSYDLERDEETRLMHRQGFVATDLARSPHDGRLVLAAARDDATTGLTVTRADGLFGRNLSMSDSVDQAPCWRPDEPEQILFQSSAIVRDENGFAVGQSPYRLEQLNLESQDVLSLDEDSEHDLLQPAITDDGGMWCIRRPWKEQQQRQVSFWQLIQDVVLFPFRLARTFIYLFNFLSMAVTGKPLMPAGGPQRSPANPWMTLYGQAVDTRQALQKKNRQGSLPPLVPKQWELLRRVGDDSWQTVARHVLTYDVTAEGTCVWTDGNRIYQLQNDGESKVLLEASLVERLCVMCEG